MNPVKSILLFFIAIGSNLAASAAEFSYVFIQGDKKTPIYTKVEGVMMPRYGKNYALLAPLAPGPMNLEILFQQNEHPPLHFRILVPENGKRAFLLSRKEGKFALYDIQQNFYLQDDNAFEDDHMPAVLTNKELAAVSKTLKDTVAATDATQKTSVAEVGAETQPVTETAKQAPELITDSTVSTDKTIDAALASGTTVADTTNKQPEFIEGITFDNDHSDKINIGTSTTPAVDTVTKATQTTSAAVINSDCKSALASEKYFRIRGEMRLMPGEDQRLGAIEEAVKQHCFSTKQAGELTNLLSSDIAKLSALKSFYPKITDQSEFASLASLIKDTDTRNYFLNFLKP